MPNLSPFRALALTLCASLAWLALARQSPSNDILVAAKDGSVASVKRGVAEFGNVVGIDEKTGLVRVRLLKGLNPEAVKKNLQHAKAIRLAISANSAADPAPSLLSVNEHAIYLNELRETGHRGEATGDFWHAYQHWFKDHSDVNGKLHPELVAQAIAHRDQMPVAQMPTSGHAPVASGSWTFMGPKNLDVPFGGLYNGKSKEYIAGRVMDIAVDPTNHSIIYAATLGGIFKTTDGGTAWTPLSDSWPLMMTSAVAIDPNNHLTVYAGTGDYGYYGVVGNGIMKSTDGGATWHNYGSANFAGLSISRIIVDPTNSQDVVATAGKSADGNNGGIFSSTDGGLTWSEKTTPNSSFTFDGLDISAPGNGGARTFWAIGSSYFGPAAGPALLILYSTDHGQTWNSVASNPSTGSTYGGSDIACSKLSAGTVFVLDHDRAGNSHIWKTTNGGTSWGDIHTGSFPEGTNAYNWSQFGYDTYMRTGTKTFNNVTTDVVFVGLITVAACFDGNGTWTDIGQTYSQDNTGSSLAVTHNDQHGFIVDPTDPTTGFFGNDGGIYRYHFTPTSNSAANGTFTTLNGNLFATQLYKLALHPSNANIVMGGAQDNAGPASSGDLNNWFNASFGDGGRCAYDPSNPLVQYVTADQLNIYQTTSGWDPNGWSTVPPTNAQIGSQRSTFGNEYSDFVGNIALAPNGASPAVLLAASNYLWSYDSSLGTWNAHIGGQILTDGGAGNTVRIVQPCIQHLDWLYTGADSGEIWLGSNFGQSWTKRVDNNKFTGIPVVSISPLSNNAYDVLVATTGGNPGAAHVWRCADTSAAIPNWNSVSGSGATALPDTPVHCILRDPYQPKYWWYAGTDVGVFVTRDGGSTWQNMTAGLGLPNIAVYDLQANATTGCLYAGTWGRGIWKIHIENANSFAIQSITLTPSEVPGGSTSTCKVTLNQPAPFGGITVTMSSDNSYAAPAKTSLVFANGVQTMSVTINTTLPSTNQTANIKASVPAGAGANTLSSPLTVDGQPITLSIPSGIMGDYPFTATVTLANAAPAGGATVTFQSNTNLYLVPTKSSILIPQGSKTGYLTIYTYPVTTNTSYTLTATYNSYAAPKNILITKGGLDGMTNPSSLSSNANMIGTVYTTGPTTVNVVISLKSDNPGLVVPSTVTVLAGSNKATFPITTGTIGAPATAHLNATLGDTHVVHAISLNP